MKTFQIALLGMASMANVPKPAAKPTPLTDRQKVLAVAAGEIGVTEKSGRNDGARVEAYIASVGLDAKSQVPYCACFVHWCGQAALGKSPYPKSAWSPDMVAGGVRVTADNAIRGGEAFGIYFASKGRVAHTGLVERREGSNLITIEGNTSASAAVGSEADRNGEGVYRKRRPWRTVHSVRDWIKN